MCAEPGEGRWLWKWVLLWSVPVYLAVWLSCYRWLFDGEWPSGGRIGVVFGHAGTVLFWAVPAWTVGMMIALPISGWRPRLTVAFGVAFLLEVVLWQELLMDL